MCAKISRKIVLLIGPALWCLLFGLAQNGRAQSTSRWLKVKSDNESQKLGTDLSNYASYISIGLLQVNLNPKQNWYSKLLSNRRKAFISTELTLNYPDGRSIADARTSEGRDLPSSGENFSLGGGSVICSRVPVTFKKLTLNVKVNTTASDKFEDMVQITNDVSNSMPEFSVGQSLTGAVGGVKSILDGLFHRQLIRTYINCSQDINADGNTKPGIYVSFAADDRSVYEKYEKDAANLYWDDNILKYNNNIVNDVSYFVTSVKAERYALPQKSVDVLSDKSRPWAPLYLSAEQLAENFTLADSAKTKSEIDVRLNVGYTLLSTDASLIHSEITAVGSFLRDNIGGKYNARKAALMGGTAKTVVATKNTKTEQQTGWVDNLINNFKSLDFTSPFADKTAKSAKK